MFNKSEIMKRAWELFKANYWGQPGFRNAIWARSLRSAWAEAKAKAGQVSKAETVSAQIESLHNKDRWSSADYQRMDALNAELREAA